MGEKLVRIRQPVHNDDAARHLQGSNGHWNLQPVLRIEVEDEKPRSQLKWKCFLQLLDDPPASRMLGDVEVQDASTAVADDEPVTPTRFGSTLGWL